MAMTKKQAMEQDMGKKTPVSKRVKRKSEGIADWESANPRLLQLAIAKVAASGGCLRIGYTRDGGAYAIGVYGDTPQPYTDYVRPEEEIDDYLSAIIEAWQ